MFKFFKEKLQSLFGKKPKEAEAIEETEKAEEKHEEQLEKAEKQLEKKEKIEKAVEELEEKVEKKQERKQKKEIKELEEKVEKEKKLQKKQESKLDKLKSLIKKHEAEVPEPPALIITEEITEQQPEEISEQEITEQKTEEKAEEKVQESVEKHGFFAKIQSRFNTVKLDKELFNDFFEKLEMLLLENNVALDVVDKIRLDLEKRLINIEIKKDRLEEEIKSTLRESILEILIEPFDLIEKIKSKKDGPFVILFFGINGSGKTTTIAKIADKLNKNNITSVLAAADTFRAASIEQLKKHGEKLGIKVIHQNYGSDPAAVAYDAISYAKAHEIKVVLIDTAGRMHTKDNLLKEMEKIVRVTQPDLKIFVAESITGNDATEQARSFNEIANIDGTILTKSDVDEKGGTAISIGYVTSKPILFLGTGQEYKDLIKFSPKEIIINLGLD